MVCYNFYTHTIRFKNMIIISSISLPVYICLKYIITSIVSVRLLDIKCFCVLQLGTCYPGLLVGRAIALHPPILAARPSLHLGPQQVNGTLVMMSI